MTVKYTPEPLRASGFRNSDRVQAPMKFPGLGPSSALITVGVAPRATLERAATPAAERQANVSAIGAPVPIIFGTDMIGGQVSAVLSTGYNLYLRVNWCVGECDAISSVLINGEATYSGVTRVDHLGVAGDTVDTMLQAAYAAKGITYTDTLPGVCYSAFRINSLMIDAFPEFIATVRGLKVKASAGATPAYSTVPAYCVAAFVENAAWGMGRTINWTSVAAVAATNNETVGGEVRRTLNLTLLQERPVEEWLTTLCAYAGCWWTDEGGVIELIPDAAAASSKTFTADNIVEGSMRIQKAGKMDVPTVIWGVYTDTSKTPYVDGIDAVVYAPGVLEGTTPWRESTVPMPGVNRYSQMMRELTERINKLTLQDLSAQFAAFDEGLAVTRGQVITVTHPIGLTSKLMRVDDVRAQSPGRYAISGVEYDAAVWSDSVQTRSTTSDTELPVPGVPPTLTGLVAVEEVYRTGDGLISSRARVTWTDPDWPHTLQYLVEIFDGLTLVHTGVAWDELYISPAMQEGRAYSIAVRVVSKSGVAGTAASTTLTMNGKLGTLPGNVPSFVCVEAGGKVYARWTAATDLDTLDYEIRYGTVGAAGTRPPTCSGSPALAYTIEGIPAGTWDFLIKARDSYKQYRATEAEQTVTVTLDSAATALGNRTFSSPTLSNMVAYAIDGVTRWTTDNGSDTWSYGYTGTAWNSDSRIDNVWVNPTGAATCSWTSDSWDLGSTLAATVSTNLAPVAHLGTATVEIGYSADDSTYVWVIGAAAKVVGRYIRVRASSVAGAMTIVGPITATATGMTRREPGTVTVPASGTAIVTLSSAFTQYKSIQLTPYATTAQKAVCDAVETSGGGGIGSGYCLRFAANTNYVNVADHASLDIADVGSGLLLEALIKRTGSGGSVAETIIRKASNYILRLHTDGSLRAFVWASSGTRYNITSSYVVPLNQWVRVSFSFDTGLGPLPVFWVNGVVVDAAYTESSQAQTLNGALTIGGDGSGTTESFNGLIDDVRVWTGSHTPTALFEELVGNESGLVGYWKFNEGTGTTVDDASPNSNTGTLTNAPKWRPYDGFDVYLFDAANAATSGTVGWTFEGA